MFQIYTKSYDVSLSCIKRMVGLSSTNFRAVYLNQDLKKHIARKLKTDEKQMYSVNGHKQEE